MNRVCPSLLVVLSLAAATGCNRAEAKSNDGVATTAAATPAAAAPAPAPKPEPAAMPSEKVTKHVELTVASVGNTMTFDKKTLTVPTGAEVHLIFKNNSTMSTLPHNWVLVKAGTEAAVAAAGLAMGEKAGYLDVRDKDILFFAPFAKPGESSDVTFTAPEPGDYPYICSIPGHYMMMKGTLTVTPAE